MLSQSTLGRGIQDAADKETQKGPYNPFDNVAVYAVEDDEELGLYKGQVLVMPAINLFYFQHNQLQGHAMEALDIALLLTGIGEIKAAVSVGRFILAASNIILGSGNIVVRSFGHELPEGWVQSWHSISHKIITFQLLELGLTGIFNARKILIGLRQTAATVANVAKKTLLQMIDVCEQLLELSERILTTFDELWLGNLLTDLEASMLEFAEYGSLAYFNLKAAIENRLTLLKERAARMAAPKPYEESQLSYKQEGNIEYLDVDLGGGMVVKLKRVDGGEWIVSGSKAPPEMYNTGKPMPKWPRNEEVLERLPERYRRVRLDVKKNMIQSENSWLENLETLLGEGTKAKINSWISKGLSEEKLESAFFNSEDKAGLLNKLETSKSIYHQRVHIEDWDNIPNIAKADYSPNGLSSGLSNAKWQSTLFDLPASDAANFVNATATELPQGTKIYRVTGGNPAGAYWTIQKPNSIGEVIGGTAVQPAWNDFSKMYMYEVPQGTTLKVWQGTTAKQPIAVGVKNPHLPGGDEQLFLPEVVRDDIFKKSIQQISLPW